MSPSGERRSSLGTVSVAFVAGVAGSAAMIPPGLLLRRAFGYALNVYGELLLRALVGRVTPALLMVEHLLIGWAMALPVAAVLQRVQVVRPILVGSIYGAGIWLVVNSLALPWAFGRATPWVLGLPAIWPSLLVHVVYGAVAFAVAARRVR